jgi:hypothetical protein
MSIADMWNDWTSAGARVHVAASRRTERKARPAREDGKTPTRSSVAAHQHQTEGGASHNSAGGTGASGHHA